MRCVRALFCLAIPFALAQCGLPSSYYLAPPGQGTLATSTTPNFYVISTISISDAGFRGFDLYYKFYSSISSIEAGYSGSTYTYENLVSAGFFPVCAPTDTSYQTRSRPLIAVPSAYRGTSFTIQFTFAGDGTFSYVTTNTTVAVADPWDYGAPGSSATALQDGMRRAPEDTDPNDNSTSYYNTAKRFNLKDTQGSPNYLSTDVDLTDTSVISAYGTSQPIFVAIYAVSVAYDSSQGYYYSYPIYLGYAFFSNYSS